ncbi:hypothetical protein [Clostridium beijerinckii]|uniref:hypothetical protein n=1 Tax=Clostridium beijerinckii TaxID=1520 RepID=UPI00080A42B8|nr:hypothetical protein [Clostridium beijerinckii]OCA97239.1 hypothetical protein BGS1_21285 [Clostridium beijerinckii]
MLIYCLGYEQLAGKKVDFIQLHNLNIDDRNQEQNIDTRPVMEANLVYLAEEVKTASEDIKNNNLHKTSSKEKCEKCYMKLLRVSSEDVRKHNIILDDEKRKT